MSRLASWFVGAGMGATIAYLFDSRLGIRRRALLRDQLIHVTRKSLAAADATGRDLCNRATGTVAELRSLARRDDATDDVIEARVRSTMGHYSSHPAPIEVRSDGAWVTLRGPILESEKAGLVAAVQGVRGVRGVADHLTAHRESEGISALQGGARRRRRASQLVQTNWPPAMRLAAGGLGGLMMVRCLRGAGPASPVLGALGFGLLLRSATNLETKRMLGISPGRRGIDITKSITIDRPVEEVFELLAEPTNYPRFSDVIRSTEKVGERRYRKTVAGPGGVTATLEESLTRVEPNELVAWRSEPNSAVAYAGFARFMAVDDGRTSVAVHATYNPPLGILSHSAAMLAGYDLKSQMDDLLLRAKAYLESGKQPHDAAEKVAAGE